MDDCNYALIDDLDKLGLTITVNSNTKILNIKGKGKMIGTVALYNMVGQKVKEFTLKNVDVFESTLTSLSSSVYLIVVQLEKAAISKKVWLGD